MSHPLDCPSCKFTTRVSDDLFERKVSGRRVKIPCKGCREPMVVDATTTELRILPYHPSKAPSGPRRAAALEPASPPLPPPRDRGSSWVPEPAPMARARSLIEDELPTLRRNEIPQDEAFLPPSALSEPPATVWQGTIPPLASSASLHALLAPAPRRERRGWLLALVLVAGGLASAGAWAAMKYPIMSELLAQAGSKSGHGDRADAAPATRPEAEASTEGAAPRLELSSEPEAVVAPMAASDATAVAAPTAAGEPTAVATLTAAAGYAAAPAAAAAPTVVAEPAAEPEPEPALQPFDKAAAAASLVAAEGQAVACRAAGDPSGTAKVVVTFAPSGRVTSATVSGPPFAGTPTGSCIAGRLRAARVPQFEGSYVTVTKTVLIR